MRRIFLIVLLLLTACRSDDRDRSTEVVTFQFTGTVIEIDTSRSRLMIAHEEIPDYMPAMTMPFKVKNPDLLESVLPGDSVAGILSVSRIESWLSHVVVIDRGGPPDPFSGSGLNAVSLLRPGDRLPDLTLLNQEGKRVRLRDYRGKVLALTFIYTRCPIPDFCIRMSDYFSKIQRAMKKSTGESDPWHLLTVSFDPVFDRPSVMKAYGETYGADFSRWSFLTDPETGGETVERLAGGFDLLYEDDGEALIAHNLRTALIDRNGVLSEVVRDNDWTPEEIVGKMKDLLAD